MLEEEIENSERVELILSMMLRLFNMAYNPDANAIEPEEFTKAVLKLDINLVVYKLGLVSRTH